MLTRPPTIPSIPLQRLCEGDRFRILDTAEAYFRGRQDDGKRYDWDGNIASSAADGVLIAAGWRVPHAMRKPRSRYDVGRLIVLRLTSMVFGQGRFPEIKIEDDEDAEDYVKTLARESRLATRMAEARNFGGAEGTACLSFGFVNGAPRVQVHNPKHVNVVSWADEDELRPSGVLKAYSYPVDIFDDVAGRVVRKTFWKVRWWDTEREITWRGIPDNVARTEFWHRWENSVIVHGYGFCPFYWIQNRPCSGQYDGEGDFAGQEPTLDEINRLMSATTKGTIANVDPTLVVKADPTQNQGTIYKGSENAIFCVNGADYLELKGTAVQAAERQVDRLARSALEVSGVVLADPEKLSGAAQSARALEIIYAPMLSNCDTLRDQYGDHGIKPILLDMLRAARKLGPGAVVLPPYIEKDGETVVVRERLPGKSEVLALAWSPYFSPTWSDISSAANAARTASGNKPIISHKTAVAFTAKMFGVQDVDVELDAIKEEQEEALKTAQRAFQSAGPDPFAPKKPGEEPPDDEDEDEDEPPVDEPARDD
ncbi:MAG: hypothetical protein RIS45_1099 [Planctomycetota bacterium]|jgi:hypothetical protein